ncbi:class B sortase [Thermophilibacter provencensis]|uniref:Class B sortase n=1 Tax=Thermophilibacter provencensis TaxID=1852386 RepID=A0A921KLN6_9ACTN|nr:class B sortase [Thermophilibacter provencensis]HJF45533.1 class B sortase [Thermophilibacter provencensis]
MGKREERGAQGASSSRRKGVVPLVAALVVLLAIAGCGVAYLVMQNMAAERVRAEQQEGPDLEAPAEQAPTEPVEDARPANPVDFPTLKAEHPDVYAWITIPDTQVNYPVVQSATDDNFYLRRDLDGNYSVYGSIYSQSMNATDFSDPVTVLYGHNSSDGLMFADLHKFEDPEYFAAHEDMYIYTPGHILTYRIISAYRYDDRHILNSFDFSDPEVRQQYFESVLNPVSMVVNVREGATLSADDRIVQLSTCPREGSVSGNRYLVTGVLVSDVETR